MFLFRSVVSFRLRDYWKWRAFISDNELGKWWSGINQISMKSKQCIVMRVVKSKKETQKGQHNVVKDFRISTKIGKKIQRFLLQPRLAKTYQGLEKAWDNSPDSQCAMSVTQTEGELWSSREMFNGGMGKPLRGWHGWGDSAGRLEDRWFRPQMLH